MIKKVLILLSSYNGEKFIKQQINSILNQQDVKTYILVRDDGSNDNTVQIIKNIQKQHPKRIEIIEGKNIGYKKSFTSLCSRAPRKFDYYAFSDQDDFWQPQKISNAIKCLEYDNSNSIKLYASTVNITDENLNFIYKKDISNFVNSLGSSLSRIRLAGCTYVFNVGALNLIRNFNYSHVPDKIMPSHDGLLMVLCQAVNGYVFIDQNSYILHRRRAESVTSGGNGLIKRIKIEKDMIFKHKNDKLYLVKYLKENYSNQMSKETLKLINLIEEYPSSFKKHINLLFNNDLNCGLKFANLETKIRIITNNF